MMKVSKWSYTLSATNYIYMQIFATHFFKLFKMKIKNKLIGFLVMICYNGVAQDANSYLIPYRQGDLWGYSTADKHIIVKPKYTEANWFSEGFASVKVGNKYGYINTLGALIIPAKFTIAKSFRKGYVPKANNTNGDSVLFAGASLKADGYEICINQKGETMLKCPAMNENSYEENHIPVQTISKQKNYSLANSEGYFDKITDDYKLEGNDETFYVAIKNNMYGVINSKFETVIPFDYSSIINFRNGKTTYLQVIKNSMHGILNGNGQIIINPEYSGLLVIEGSNANALVLLQQSEKTYLKDLLNNDMIPGNYSNIIYEKKGGFIITGDNNLKGYYFLNNMLIRPKYKDIKMIADGKYLLVKTITDKQGYINENGDEYFVE